MHIWKLIKHIYAVIMEDLLNLVIAKLLDSKLLVKPWKLTAVLKWKLLVLMIIPNRQEFYYGLLRNHSIPFQKVLFVQATMCLCSELLAVKSKASLFIF